MYGEIKSYLRKLFIPLSNIKVFWIILSLGLVVFFRGLFNGFVTDDWLQIVDNPIVHSLGNINSFFTGSTFYNSGPKLVGQFYRPLLTTYFSFVYSIFGAHSFWFHLTQLFFHSLNAFLVYLLFKKFISKSLSLAISLIFLVHPINSESVFYISGTGETLFLLFGLLTFLILVERKISKYYYLTPVLLLLGLLSKEAGILIIGVVLIYLFLYEIKKLPYFILVLLPLLVFYFLLKNDAVGLIPGYVSGPINRLGFSGRLLNIPEMVFFYLKTFFVPINLSSVWGFVVKQASVERFYLPLFIDLALCFVAVFFTRLIYKRNKKLFKLYLFFTAWFVLGLSLYIQILPLDTSVSERWFYFPIIGVLGMIGVLLEAYGFRVGSAKTIILFSLILILLSARTFVRSFDWNDDLTLALHDIKVAPDSYILEDMIRDQLLKQGKLEEAKIHALKSIELFPFATNNLVLGTIYFGLNDFGNAKQSYLNALNYVENYQDAYEGLARIALVSGDPQENIDFIKNKALIKYPKDGQLWLSLAIIEYKSGRVDEAKKDISQAKEFLPSPDVDFYYKKIMNNETLPEIKFIRRD